MWSPTTSRCLDYPPRSPQPLNLSSKSAFHLVTSRKSETMLRDEVENHFTTNRRGTDKSRDKPQIRQTILIGESISPMGLNGVVEGAQTCLSGGILCHI